MNSKRTTIDRLVSTIILAVLVMGMATAARAALYSEDFETGYAAGALTGQNGWTNDFTNQGTPGNNHVIDIAGGNPGVGASHTGGGILRGNATPHGVPIISGSEYSLSGDVFMNVGSYTSIGLRGAGGKYFLMQAQNTNPGTGWFLDATDLPSQGPGANSGNVSAQWYHMNLDWTVGGNATWSVYDAGNALVFSDTFSTAAFAGPSGLTHFEIFSSGNATAFYDNLVFVPEPSSMALIGFGALALVMRRK